MALAMNTVTAASSRRFSCRPALRQRDPPHRYGADHGLRAPIRSAAVPSRRGGRQAHPVRRLGGERLAHRRRHHAAAGRVGHAGRRRPDRPGRRDELAAAEAAGRCPACGERDQGGDAVAHAGGPRHRAHAQRNPQPARRGGADSDAKLCRDERRRRGGNACAKR